MTIRLLLADDHRMLREGLRRSMDDEGFDVVGEAADGEEAVRLADELRPDVILMDVTMPEIDGVEATRQLHEHLPEIPVVMLTMHADHEVLAGAIRAGAAGYLVKDCSTDEVAARRAHGRQRRDRAVARAGRLDARRGARLEQRRPRSDRIITEREEEVLQLIADGCSTPEVAASSCTSARRR